MGLPDWKLRLRALLFPRRAERDLADEVEFHLAMHAHRNCHRGMGEDDARRSARAEFGGVSQTMEECRDRRGVAGLAALARDVRYAVRGFRRTPAFCATVIATIALALGLNAALFTLFDTYVLKPLAVRDPATLYTWAEPGGGDHRLGTTDFERLRRDSGAFAEVAGAQRLIARADGHLLAGNLVTEDYFRMLGVEAMIGRTLLPDDAAVIVLGAASWRNKFGGDPGILGRKIAVRGVPLEVVGVMKPDFTGVDVVPSDFWAPAGMAAQLLDRGTLRLRVTGRLHNGWSARRTEAVLTAWMNGTRRGDRADARAVLHSQATSVPLDPVILAACSPVLAAFGLVLVIACANIGNLMLARGIARQREIGVRLAIGAGRNRIVRQLLTECFLLAAAGSALGFLVSRAAIDWCVRLVIVTMPASFVEFATLAPHSADIRVFGFMLLAAVLSAFLFGLAPALQATRFNIAQAARGEFAAGIGPERLRRFLVTGQVTVAVLFLVCASILLRANRRFETLNTGLETRNVVAIETRDPIRARLLLRLAASPEVAAVAASSKAPFAGILPPALMQPAGSRDLWWTGYLYTSPEYFDLFRVPVVRGRAFTAAEAAAGAPVAAISENTARLWWPHTDPIGQSFRISLPAGRRPPIGQEHAGIPPFAAAQVIGVARDAVNGWVGNGQADRTCIYFPRPAGAAGNVVYARLRGRGDAGQRRLVAALDRALPGALDQIHSLDEIFAVQIYPWRALYWAATGVGGLALLLTLSGIYGVMAYVVTQRTKEIGIRVALGASTGSVSRLVLGQSLRMAAIGALAGSAGAQGMAQLAVYAGVPYSWRDFDLAGSVIGVAVVLAAAGCAAWLPSRRAARVQPIVALRCD